MEDIAKTVTGIKRSNIETNDLLPAAGSQNGFTPSFYVIDRKSFRQIEIKPDDVVFSFGKGDNNDIIIHDNAISVTQMRAVLFNEEWYFMDAGIRDALAFNGVRGRQTISKPENRLIVKCGNSWIIYVGLNSSAYNDTDSVILRKSILNNTPRNPIDDACATITCENQTRETSSAPILVGSHSVCDFRIKDLEPFHFIIYWSQDGLFVEDLTKGQPGAQLNGMKLINHTPLRNESSITVGKHVFSINISGSIELQKQGLTDRYNQKPRLALSSLNSTVSPVVLRAGLRDLSIGRHPKCDIMIVGDSVSRQHAKISSRDKSLMLEDLQSANGTFVNLKPIQRAVIVPGDIIEIGHEPFLLHYEKNPRL
jgi:hypothetical protein